MAQDVRFFDAAAAGELSAATSDTVQALQNGTSKKLAELVQASCTAAGGLAVVGCCNLKLVHTRVESATLFSARKTKICGARGPRRKPGAFSYTLTRFSLSL